MIAAEPLRVGPLVLRNRIVFPAHLTNFATGGHVTDRHVEYYRARARGGAGLIVTEEHSVHPADRPYEYVLRGHDPAILDGYRRLTDAVHADGAAILAQLNHNGPQGTGLYSDAVLVAPGPVPDPMFREVPHPLSEEGIDALVACYADVAARCRAGGFDGVEIQCSQASLVRAFLAEQTNRRDDRYGEDRALFAVRVVAAVREAVGGDVVVGVRVSGYDGTAGGLVPADAAALVARLDAAGLVDYVNTSIGVATETLHLIEASMATPGPHALFAARAASAVTSVPVIGVGRFTTAHQVEDALASGACHLVGAARAQIADAEFAAKVTSGRGERIRPCVGCNQDCIGRVGAGLPIGCALDPRSGCEGRSGAARGSGRRRRILVVGAGPAGLSAALAAARDGHTVEVVERHARVGGRLAVAARAPHRAEWLRWIAWLERECVRRGVRFRTAELDVGSIVDTGADTVIVATGSVPVVPDWASGPVVDVADVLAGAVEVSGTVAVVDESGSHAEASTVEFLAELGRPVLLVTPAMSAGQHLVPTLDIDRWRRRCRRLGVEILTDTVVAGWDGATLGLENHRSGVRSEREVDTVVVATRTGDTTVADALGRLGVDVHVIGDARAPATVDVAVREAADVVAAFTA